MRTALLWVIKQPVVVIPYRRFGTAYGSHIHGSRNLEDGTNSSSLNVSKKLPILAT